MIWRRVTWFCNSVIFWVVMELGKNFTVRVLKRGCDNMQSRTTTKVLRHFRKMTPFCVVDKPILFPCLPHSLPPKINVVFWTQKSFFYFRKHWFGGWREMFNKSTLFNKCVNYFRPWLSEIWYLCFPARFLMLLNFGAMKLLYGPNCLFINSNL